MNIPLSTEATARTIPHMGELSHSSCGCYRLAAYNQHLRFSPANTARTYRYLVTSTFAELHGRIYDGPTVRKWLRDQKRTGALQVRQNALKHFFAWSVKQGHIASNPLIMERAISGADRPPQALEDSELAKLLDGARTHPVIGELLACAIQLQAMIGVRPGELLGLTPNDFNLERGTVTVYASKTQKYRVIPLNKTAHRLASWASERTQGTLFPWGVEHYYNLIRESGKRAQLPAGRAKPYALRHTFARSLIDQAVPLPEVQQLLGHANLNHTWRYVKANAEHLRSAVNKIG